MRDSLIEQRVGVLLPSRRAAAHDGVELGTHDDVGQPITSRPDSAPCERGGQVASCQMRSTLQCLGDDRVGFGEEFGVELVLPVVVGIQGVHPRRRDFEQPADVFAEREVPRGA